MAFLPMLVGCIEEESVCDDAGTASGNVLVKVCFEQQEETRSIVSPDEYALHDVNVFAFRNGLLEEDVFVSGATEAVLELMSGSAYDIYAVANMGDMEPCTTEDDFLETFCYGIDSISELNSSVPMRWSGIGIEVNESMAPVTAEFSRLVSKIGLSVDKSLLDNLEIRSVRLCQCAMSVFPFNDFGGCGSKVMSASQVEDGDYASESDLNVLNAGDRISFYSMENCQGVLLPDNTDAWSKIPDSLGDLAGLCTYMEISCEFGEESQMVGETVYRFYLGMDDCRDFNVPGNSNIDVCLTLTDDGMNRISWRVEADAVLREGLATGRPVGSRYEMNDLYVGEVFKYQVSVTSTLLAFYDGDISECILKFVPDSGSDTPFTFGPLSKYILSYRSDVQCRKPGTGAIWLCRPDGRKIVKLQDGVTVRLPAIVVSDLESVDDSYIFLSSSSENTCVINGNGTKRYVYLVDRLRRNLNASDAEGFNFRFFKFSASSFESDFDISESLSCSVRNGQPASGAYAYVLTMSCSHDGTDQDLKVELADAYNAETAFRSILTEENHGLSCSSSWDLDIDMITVTLVDNGWADHHDCQISAEVDNPSGLPLDLSIWQVNTSDDSWNAISRNEIIDYVETSLDVRHIKYMNKYHYAGAPPLYGAGCTFRSGSQSVYPLASINTSDMYYSMLYDKRGQVKLCHLVDVSVGGSKIKCPAVSVIDALSDGSSRYDVIYGIDGWNDRGIWLYRNDASISDPGPELDDYGRLTPLVLDHFVQMFHGEVIDLNFSYYGDDLYVYSQEGYMKHLSVDLEYTITAKGYVKTYPNGTWGASKDNNCTEVVTGSVSGVPLFHSAGMASADDGLIRKAMDAVYANTYSDSKNMIGSANSYKHHAHPVSVVCEILVKVSGASPYEMYPVSLEFDVEDISYYHEQEDKTYSCTFSSEVPLGEFVWVEKLDV